MADARDIEFLRINRYLNAEMARTYYITDIHVCIDDFAKNLEFTIRLRSDLVPEWPLKVRATMIHRHACVCIVESDNLEDLRCALPAQDYFDFKLSPITSDIYIKLWVAGIGEYGDFSFSN